MPSIRAVLALALSGHALGQDCASMSKAECVAEEVCAWCEAGAVPSRCYMEEDAKRLPPGVFQCTLEGAGAAAGRRRRHGSELPSRAETEGVDAAAGRRRRHGSELPSRAETEGMGAAAGRRRRHMSELLSRAETQALGITWRGNHSGSHDAMNAAESYPDAFSWCDKDGVSYCTMSRNQHIPQYCGSCWAHGAVSALGDRIKIARGAKGIDINLAVQHILNCGNIGSCHGGSIDGVYQWLMGISKAGTGISYESTQPYMACSAESTEGFCPNGDWTCKPINVARTCGSFDKEGGACTGLSHFPNATISDYGSISGVPAMMKEIYNRGPIACGIDANPLLNYESGIIKEESSDTDHVISVVGWGTDPAEGKYWIVRNSWGEYWGDMGYVPVAFGALNIEDQCSWAVPGEFTAAERHNQVRCHEGGDNCNADKKPELVV